MSPSERDLNMLKIILSLFEGASGLACNVSKTQVVPTRCQEEEQFFPCVIAAFPVKYLGIPLSVTKMPKSALRPLVEKMADRLAYLERKTTEQKWPVDAHKDYTFSYPCLHLHQPPTTAVGGESNG